MNNSTPAPGPRPQAAQAEATRAFLRAGLSRERRLLALERTGVRPPALGTMLGHDGMTVTGDKLFSGGGGESRAPRMSTLEVDMWVNGVLTTAHVATT